MLTEKTVRALEKPGRYKDERTLFLLISPGGSKSWIQRLFVYGRRRELGLGAWPVIPLAKARLRALENRRVVADGGDPTMKAAQTVPTLAEACQQYYEEHLPRWKPGRAADEWPVLLEKYVLKQCGRIPVDKLGRDHLINTLKPLSRRIPETARKVRGRVSLILKWCQAHGYISDNVAEVIRPALQGRFSKSTPFRAVPYKNVGEVWAALSAESEHVAGKLCVQFLLLTAVRSQEGRLGEWGEIDFGEAVWTIPSHRTKTSTTHRIPLSHQALAILHLAKELGSPRYVFPSPINANVPIGHATPRKTMHDCGVSSLTTIHGLRASFRTWASEETTTPFDVLELALGHKVGNAVATRYLRGDGLERRRSVMQEWADYATGRRGLKVRTVTTSENV